ncbi:hypothetical protein NADFUDRAFT_77165 [Nadsonia fulvescens var. elongata DSM 6958]|uniref:Uncharacterized protein n=1 Tax=Nadsonia fulvescens var. elongata DSM 6958 TaxID=857566 RepID=A0A1E3PNY1_9ASCO|nr:hypothetical protein NADFUDRAFT_77165 [Nadsonia fulvescens var. elongata DSM 6958]
MGMSNQSSRSSLWEALFFKPEDSKQKSKRINSDVNEPYDFVQNFRPNISYIPMKLSPSHYKILKSTVPLERPQIEPAFAIVHNGPFTHTWSLLPDISSASESFNSIKPLAAYITNYRNLSHGNIIRFRAASKPIRAPVGGGPLADISYSFLKHPIDIRLALGKLGTNDSLEFIVDNFHYIWAYREVPANSGKPQLMLHFIPETNDSDSVFNDDYEERTAVNYIPVGRVVESPFRCPISGKREWSLELDATKIEPIDALLSCFALKTTHMHVNMFASVFGRSLRPSRLLPSIMYPEEPLPAYSSTRESCDSPDSLLVNNLAKLFPGGYVNDCPVIDNSRYYDNEDSESLNETRQNEAFHIFDASVLDRYRLMDCVYATMNQEALRTIKALEARYPRGTVG